MAGPRLVYTYQLVGEWTDSDWLVGDLLEENFGGVLSLFGPQLQQLRQVKQLPPVSKQLSYNTPANTKNHIFCVRCPLFIVYLLTNCPSVFR